MRQNNRKSHETDKVSKLVKVHEMRVSMSPLCREWCKSSWEVAHLEKPLRLNNEYRARKLSSHRTVPHLWRNQPINSVRLTHRGWSNHLLSNQGSHTRLKASFKSRPSVRLRVASQKYSRKLRQARRSRLTTSGSLQRKMPASHSSCYKRPIWVRCPLRCCSTVKTI